MASTLSVSTAEAPETDAVASDILGCFPGFYLAVVFSEFFRNPSVASCVSMTFAALTIAGRAQEPPVAPTPQNTPEARALPVLNYSKPVSHFPNPIGPYTPRHLAAPNLANTARIDQFMHDGKLYLSLNDAIALALENNLDIAIARLT